jgi:hypothetical protein
MIDESTQTKTLIWKGDLDLTFSEDKLKVLAKELGHTIAVFHEGSFSFEDFIKGPGTEIVPSREPAYSTDGNKTTYNPEYYTRFSYKPPEAPAPEGSLVQKHVLNTYHFNLSITEPEESYEDIQRRYDSIIERYKKEDFQCVVTEDDDMPPMGTFLLSSSYETSPVEAFFNSISDKLSNFGPNDEIYLYSIDYMELMKAQKAWEECVNGSWRQLDRYPYYCSCADYGPDPDFIEPGCVYIRKRD